MLLETEVMLLETEVMLLMSESKALWNSIFFLLHVSPQTSVSL